ncbi:MAG: NgoPII family restriction endonuclease [Aphanothece sp. CMT-3BRIN-NPC111]|nr:NgoPII family restriction endonuclease [Aphanothece sp. CMT-3BRIN-NPC111]
MFLYRKSKQSSRSNDKKGKCSRSQKIQSLNYAITLNSSYPKAKLYQDSAMITSACRKCESWTEKDIIYAIGVIQEWNGKQVVKLLWLI